MKYVLKFKKDDIFNYRFINNKLYHTSRKENHRLFERDLQSLQLVWKGEKEETSNYVASEKWIILSQYETNEVEVLENITKQVYFTIPYGFALNDTLFNDKYLVGCKGINEPVTVIVVDIINKKVNVYEDTGKSADLLIGDKVVCIDEKDSTITLCSLEGLEMQWRFDITQFGPYKEWDFIKKEWEERRREVNRLYFYRGKIIVTLSRAIIALEPQTGKLLWKIDFEDINPIELVFDEDVAYLGELLHLFKIDIEKGKILYHNYNPSYSVEVNGYKLTQITYHGLTLYKNYLWLARNMKGREFLFKINPNDGLIVEGMLLDTNYPCETPIFQDNRMYIQDQVGDMYVYEEVEEGSVTAAEQEEEEVYTQVLNVKGKKHVFIYSESWSRELEDKLESFLIQYWVNSNLNTGDEVKFVFQRTDGINQENLYEEVIKFLDCDRVRAILSSIPSNNVKAITGQEVHPEYQPYWLVNFFKEKDNFQKYFEVVE